MTENRTVSDLQAEIEQLEQRLADFEAQSEAVQREGQALMSRWRLASLAADVDGDPEAQAEAAELQRQLSEAQFVDQRRQNAISEIRNRIRAKQSEIERAKYSKPVKFLKRIPAGEQSFGGIRRALKLPAGNWEPVSEDRLIYELRRQYPDSAGAVMRSLRAGSVVPVREWEVKAVAENDHS